MSRLVVASNRVADISKPGSAGGLAVAVGDALQELGGLWFGWDGEVTDTPRSPQPRLTTSGRVTLAMLSLSEEEYENYYLGYANSVLWPVLHYRLDLAELDAAYLRTYRSVNQRFAHALGGLLKPDDVVWIHDYHLFPLAAELRAQGFGQRFGFFLHIPFPPPDMFVALPGYEWLIRCIFSYDLVGFQTEADLVNFQRVVQEHADGVLEADGRISAFGRTIKADAFPIGIDVETFRAMARTRKADDQIEKLRRRTIAGVNIIGVDRLDYTKGLPERFKAFRLLLENYPENRKYMTLMQIAPPTREDVDAYADIRMELEGLSGAINGAFGDIDWTPIRYIHRNVARDVLAALFRGCEVGLVTPLRDGMNLVAKEYVAAQDDENPGVLILSRFAGAAETMDEALVVNPYDANEVAQSMQRAATMPLEERRERHAALYKRIEKHDVSRWRREFLAALGVGQEVHQA